MDAIIAKLDREEEAHSCTVENELEKLNTELLELRQNYEKLSETSIRKESESHSLRCALDDLESEKVRE